MGIRSVPKTARAVSLVEIMVATGVLATIVLISISAMMQASRISREAIEDQAVMELLNRQTELVKSNLSYSALGVTAYVGTESLQLDPNPDLADRTPAFTITYQWYGFGTVTNSTSTSISFNDSAWPEDVDFTGQRVLLRPTSGITSSGIAEITSHTDGRFDTSCAFNGWDQVEWNFSIPNGMYFEVDGGKWCRMTVTWEGVLGRTRSMTRDIFIPWRADT